jgi:hypothetical protein
MKSETRKFRQGLKVSALQQKLQWLGHAVLMVDSNIPVGSLETKFIEYAAGWGGGFQRK